MPSLLLSLAQLTLVVVIFIYSAHCKAFQSDMTIDIVAEEFYPYQYQENGEAKGIAIEVIKQVLATGDLKPNIQFYPWSRALRIAESAPNTIILSITRSPEREPKFYWLGLLDRHELYLWVNKKRWGDQHFSDEMLTKLTIGVPRDGYQHQFLKSHPLFSNNHYSVVNTKEQSLSMLAMDRIDAISGDPKLLRSRMINIGLTPDLIKPVKHFPGNYTELFIAMSKNSNPELVKSISQRYARFAKTKEFKQIISNH